MATIESRVRKFLSGASVTLLEQVKNNGLHSVTNDFSNSPRSYAVAPLIAGKIIAERLKNASN